MLHTLDQLSKSLGYTVEYDDDIVVVRYYELCSFIRMMVESGRENEISSSGSIRNDVWEDTFNRVQELMDVDTSSYYVSNDSGRWLSKYLKDSRASYGFCALTRCVDKSFRSVQSWRYGKYSKRIAASREYRSIIKPAM